MKQIAMAQKIVAMGCTGALLAGLLSGCGNTTGSDSVGQSTAQSESTVTTESTAATAQSGTYAIEVTAVDGTSITGQTGTLAAQEAPDGDGTEPAEAPSGTADSNQPAKPDGEQQSGDSAPTGTPPAAPDGASAPTDGSAPADSTPPQGGAEGGKQQPGGGFTADGGSITFVLTDATVIQVEKQPGTTEDGTAADITVGAVLELTLDSENNALTVTVHSASSGMPESQQATDGTDAGSESQS
jgi:hypothetical protein